MVAADGDASDSEDSSSSGSDFQEIDAGPEDMQALDRLKLELSQNPRQYHVHCQVGCWLLLATPELTLLLCTAHTAAGQAQDGLCPRRCPPGHARAVPPARGNVVGLGVRSGAGWRRRRRHKAVQPLR